MSISRPENDPIDDPFAGLHGFVAVCEAGSIAAAARALGVPRPTVSRHLRALEAQLGTRLLHRSTRSLQRTPAGDELYARARRILDDALAARRAVTALDGVPRGLLRVSTPAGLPGAAHEVLCDFVERYPEVQLEVVSSARFVDLAAEGFDVALRGGAPADDDLIVRTLRRTELRAWASPAYAARHGLPSTLDALASHATLRHFSQGTAPQTHWPTQDGGRVAVRGRFAADSLALLHRAIRRGIGIGMLPWAPDGLLPVLPDVLGTTSALHVVFPERVLLAPKVRAFIDHVVAHADRFVTAPRRG